MSSILKALKKLEEEKAIRKGESMRVGRGILLDEPPGRKERRVIVLLIGVIVSIIVLFAMASFLDIFGTIRKTRLAVPGVSTPVPPQSVQLPALPVPSTAAQEAPAPAPSEPSVAVPALRIPLPTSTGGTPSASKVTTQAPLALPAASTTHPAKGEPAANPLLEHLPPEMPLPPVQKMAASQASAPSVNSPFSLSGIAWQKDAASRIAMINGQAVGSGGTVAGAVVEEILPDRVRLSYQGRVVDLVLGGAQ